VLRTTTTQAADTIIFARGDELSLFPVDGQWREGTGALSSEVRVIGYERAFVLYDQGFKGNSARLLWGFETNGIYEPLQAPCEA